MKRSWAGISILILLSVLTACTFTGWSTYTNSSYHFQLQYPPGSKIPLGNTDTAYLVRLPLTKGSNLDEKTMTINVQDGVSTCESPIDTYYSPGYLSPVSLSLNGLPWVREGDVQSSFGNNIDWTSYSTVSGSVCVSLTFEMSYHDVIEYGSMPTPVVDTGAESAVFIQIVDTFQWLAGSGSALSHSSSILLPTLAPTDTPSPLPSDTPVSSVKVLAPSDTPSPSPLIFTPQISPMEFNYQFQTVQGTCKTDVPQVDISVGVSDPSTVHGVVLFFRLKNKATGEETPWNDGVNMNPQGNGKYDRSLSANQIPNLTVISSGGASAWLEYQFAATNLLGSTIGRSQVYSDVSLTPCK